MPILLVYLKLCAIRYRDVSEDIQSIEKVHNLSNPKPGRTTVGSGRAVNGRAARRGEAGQDGTPTGMFAQVRTVSLGIKVDVDNSPESFFGSKNKGNLM